MNHPVQLYTPPVTLMDDDCDSSDINFVAVFSRRYGIITDYSLSLGMTPLQCLGQ